MRDKAIIMRRLTHLDWQQVTLRNSEHKPCKRWGHRCLLIGHEMVLFGGFDGMRASTQPTT